MKPYPTDHIESPDCPCGPECVFVADDGTEVWVHRDISGKEYTEMDNPALN